MSYLFGTPPWNILSNKGSYCVYCNNDIFDTVADVYPTKDEFYKELTQEANANLIAAAPEMYGLLESVLILSKDMPEKMPEIRDRIQNLFLRMGVTLTQYRLKQLHLEEEAKMIEKDKQEIEEDAQKEEEATILQKYFGDDWENYEIIPGILGYFVYHKEEEFDEYFILEERVGGVAPYYFNPDEWHKHGEAAYVIQSEPDELLVPFEGANAYYYDEIRDYFKDAGILDVDMDLVDELLNGQGIDQLIEDYKNALNEEEE